MVFAKSANLSDKIVEYILDKIIRMEYRPGDRIVESKIAKELNISRSPIREAIRVLERHRLVELVPRKGAHITELVEEEVESLFDIMSELIFLALKKFHIKAEENDIETLIELSENILDAAKNNDLDTYYKSVIIMGLMCLKCCKDRLLEQLIYELLPGIRRILYIAFSYNVETLSKNAGILVKGSKALKHENINYVEGLLREWLNNEKMNLINGLKAGNFFTK